MFNMDLPGVEDGFLGDTKNSVYYAYKAKLLEIGKVWIDYDDQAGELVIAANDGLSSYTITLNSFPNNCGVVIASGINGWGGAQFGKFWGTIESFLQVELDYSQIIYTTNNKQEALQKKLESLGFAVVSKFFNNRSENQCFVLTKNL